MKDEDIIESIRQGRNTKALRQLYAYLPVVRKHIVKNSGTRNDAIDIYQDALVVFCTQVARPDFHLSSSISTYVFSICKNKWMEELRKRGRDEKINWEIKNEIQTDDWSHHEQKLKSLQQVLKC
jgi:DNA-directed RNA polymerase specialized sigma24 family protein